MRTASAGALALAACVIARPLHADAQNVCRSTDARGNVTYADCPPATTYRPDDRQPLEQQPPAPNPPSSARAAPGPPPPTALPPTAPPGTTLPPTALPAPATQTAPRPQDARTKARRVEPVAPAMPVVIPPPLQPGLAGQSGATPPPSAALPPRAAALPTMALPSNVNPPPSVTPPSRLPWQVSAIPRPSLAIARGGGGLFSTPKKRWFLAGAPIIAIGLVLNLVATVQYLRRAFKVSVWWGLGCLLVGPVSLLFLILHWSLVKKPFVVSLLGVALIAVGIVIAKGLS